MLLMPRGEVLPWTQRGKGSGKELFIAFTVRSAPNEWLVTASLSRRYRYFPNNTISMSGQGQRWTNGNGSLEWILCFWNRRQEAASAAKRDWTWNRNPLWLYGNRSFYISDRLYTVTSAEIRMDQSARHGGCQSHWL